MAGQTFFIVMNMVLILISLIFALLIGIITYCMSKSSLKSSSSWKIGIVICIIYFLKQVSLSIVWISFAITFDFQPGSIAHISDSIHYTLFAIGIVSLYSFFIARLYAIYNSSTSIFAIHRYHYSILSILNLTYFGVTVWFIYTWITWQSTNHKIANIICLFLEIIMYIYIQSLFSKPLILLTIELNMNEATNNSTNNKTDDLLILFCKLSILNTVALLSIIIIHIFEVFEQLFCKDCQLWYISSIIWSIDAFINVYCIFNAFINVSMHSLMFLYKWFKMVL